MKSRIKDNILAALLITISIVGMVIICFTIRSNDIWYDEVFSMEFATRSFDDIVRLTGADVHPPLYYFYLKVIIDFGALIAPVVSAVIWAKIASIIPMAVLFILSMTVIRKEFGIECAALFSMLITLMPNLASYYVEIRMYAFALLIVTAAFIFAYKLVNASWRKNICCYIGFALFGILGAYTQYYVCIAIVGLYIAVGIYFIISKRYKEFIPLGICAGVSVLAYIPWLPYLSAQFGAVKQNYWIEPLTIKSIFGCIKYMYLPSIGLGAKGYAVAGIMIAATLLIIVLFLTGKPPKESMFTGFAGIVTIVIVVLTGFILSIINRPIFVYRYMVPVFGMFYLGLSFMATNEGKNKRIYLWAIATVFIIGGHYSLSSFEYGESIKPAKMEEAAGVLESLPEDAVVVTNFDQVCTVMDYYLPNHTIYLYEDSTDPIVGLMYNNDGQSISEDELVTMVNDGKSIYFFGSFNSREELLKEWKTYDVQSRMFFDSAMIERYYFNIYELYK